MGFRGWARVKREGGLGTLAFGAVAARRALTPCLGLTRAPP